MHEDDSFGAEFDENYFGPKRTEQNPDNIYKEQLRENTDFN